MKRFLIPRWTPAGFSPVETLLTLVLGSAALAALGYLFLVQPRLAESLDSARECMQNARVALEVLSREVRMSGYNPTGASFDGVFATPEGLHLKADLNGDGDTNDADEDILYTYDASTQQIMRTDRQRREVLAEHVQSFTVTGLDEAGQATTVSANIRQLHLKIQTSAGVSGAALLGHDTPHRYTLTTLVKLRNVSAVTEHERG